MVTAKSVKAILDEWLGGVGIAQRELQLEAVGAPPPGTGRSPSVAPRPQMRKPNTQAQRVLCAAWRCRIKVETTDRETTMLRRNVRAMAEAGLERAVVEAAHAWQAPDRAAASVEWSS